MKPATLLFTCASLLSAACAAAAQAPIERRPAVSAEPLDEADSSSSLPSAPLPAAPLPPVAVWPAGKGVPRGTVLLVKTADRYFAHICRLDHIAPDDVICGRNGDNVAYGETFVQSIQYAPQGYEALSLTKQTALYTGAASLFLGLECGFFGGQPCAKPADLGLGLLAGGLVLHIVQYHLKHSHPRMLYVDPGPSPVWRRGPRIFGMPIAP